MSTTDETEKFRTLSYAKWSEIVTKLCRKVLRDTCPDTGTGFNSCGYTCLLPKVTLWVIALGWDRFGFPVRFSPPVTLQIITQGQLLTWQYLEGNLIHHGDRKPRNIRLACGCSSVLLLIRQYPVDLAIQNFVL